jgi:hypothetical protein
MPVSARRYVLATQAYDNWKNYGFATMQNYSCGDYRHWNDFILAEDNECRSDALQR